MTSNPALIETLAHTQRMQIEGRDVPWLLNQWAEQTPDKTFLHWAPFDGNDRSWTYLEIQRDVIKFSLALKNRGIIAGDRVLIHMDNCPEFLISWFACAELGAIAVSTNTRSVGRDIAYFAEFTEIVCAIVQPQFADLVCSSAPFIKFLVQTADEASEAVLRENNDGIANLQFEDLLKEEFSAGGQGTSSENVAQSRQARVAEPMADLSIQFTSGTTSRPKAVLWTHANAIWGAQVNATQMRLRHEDCTLVVLPLFHTNAQSYSMLSTLWAGATMVLQPRFSASRFWSVSKKYTCTWASLIPFCVKALSSQVEPDDHQYRFWGLGAHLPEIKKRYGIQTIGWWGMTETITQGIISDMDHPGPRLSMGRSSLCYDIRVRNSAGELVGVGEKGFLTIRGVRGVSLFKEYYNNPNANRDSFDVDGWFETGDVVRFDESGNMFFCDREKDMLKVGAENVAASEIESVIMLSGLASECAVVAQKHYMLDEVPVVFIILSEGAKAMLEKAMLGNPMLEKPMLEIKGQDEIKQKVIEHCQQNLADFKVVREVHVVDSLPRSTLEKIAKNELRDRLPAIVA